MNYRCIAVHELDASLIERWAEIQSASSVYASPFFRPEFSRTVGAVRSDLRVCVLEEGNRAVGFFPFHRRLGGIARPAALGLSDHHGVIVEPEVDWTAEELMSACGIVRWEFDHLLATQAQWQRYVQHVEPSPVIDTSGSFECFLAGKRKPLETALRRRRKLEREIGELRFEARSLDPALLETVIEWKRKQCRRTGAVDFFALGWTVELLRKLHVHDTEEFAGVLSGLWSGDRLLAAHFGIRSQCVLHYWFPVYSGDFSQYSPGLVLLLELVNHACEDTVRYIDLGKDLSQYKAKFMTGSMDISVGRATVPAILNSIFYIRERLEESSRNLHWLRPIARAPGRLLKRTERLWRYN